MSGGEEAEEAAPVPQLETTSAEYKAVFGPIPTHDAVLEVVCRAAAIMSKLCGDNEEEGYTMTEAESKSLSEEAFEFVTKYVRALFGAVNTTKFHALAYHLLAELLLRGNVIEADTSVNEALHKLIKNMWDNTNKQTTSVLLQMLRAEQTLAHITESDAFNLRQSGGRDKSMVNSCAADNDADGRPGSGADGAEAETGVGVDGRDDSRGARDHDVDEEGTSCGGAELDVLSVFDELAAMGEFDAVPEPEAASTRREEHMEVEDVMEECCPQEQRTGALSGIGNATLPPVAASDAAMGALCRKGRSGRLVFVGQAAAGTVEAGNAAAYAHHAGTAGARPARRRVRISGRRTTVAQAAAADGGRLQQLLAVLKRDPTLKGCTDSSQLIIANTFKFDARLEWRVRPVGQLLRATHELYRKPWWDHVLYRVPGTHSGAMPQLGLARLLIRAVDGRRHDSVVVQRLENADARPGCVLTAFRCNRKKWVMDSTTGFPELALVPLADVQRLEHVVPDFEDLAERWGMTATPTTVPESPRERGEQRFFTNAFFAWTTNSVTDAP